MERGAGRCVEPERPRSPYLIERRVDSYRRFLRHYLRPITTALADVLWPVTVAHAHGVDGTWMRGQIDALWSGGAADRATALPDELTAWMVRIDPDGESRAGELGALDAVTDLLQAESTQLLSNAKMMLRDGIVEFESDAAPDTDTLIGLARGVQELAARHLERISRLDVVMAGRGERTDRFVGWTSAIRPECQGRSGAAGEPAGSRRRGEVGPVVG